MSDLVALLADRTITIAVVGATDSPRKFGGIIYRDLKGKGYRVLAVNPNRLTVDGDPSFPSLAALPEPPDLVDLVVPPEVGLTVVEECRRLGWRRVWVQPGAESPELLAFLEEHDFDYLAGACVMVESSSR